MTFEEFRKLGENGWSDIDVEVLGDDIHTKTFLDYFPELEKRSNEIKETRELEEKLEDLGF